MTGISAEREYIRDGKITKMVIVELTDARYPLYSRDSCPFIDEGFDCEGNGRLDRNNTKWRWQPQDCDLPRFNATKMLELIRGKRLVFVGDSINRNQWESMLCMLLSALKDPKRVYEARGRKITKEKGNYSFRFLDYQCTVEYYVSHFLVHESKARVGQKRRPTLRIDAIDHGSLRWRGADILVLNTGGHITKPKQETISSLEIQSQAVVEQKINVSLDEFVIPDAGSFQKKKLFKPSGQPQYSCVRST
ncbi:protein trichome birefringence [Trifolium repens]|nr:protein trichome birefringence [Trifolium repens]